MKVLLIPPMRCLATTEALFPGLVNLSSAARDIGNLARYGKHGPVYLRTAAGFLHELPPGSSPVQGKAPSKIKQRIAKLKRSKTIESMRRSGYLFSEWKCTRDTAIAAAVQFDRTRERVVAVKQNPHFSCSEVHGERVAMLLGIANPSPEPTPEPIFTRTATVVRPAEDEQLDEFSLLLTEPGAVDNSQSEEVARQLSARFQDKLADVVAFDQELFV